MKKFVCMKEDCNFCTSDEEDAYEHAHIRKGHDVIEIDWNPDEDPECHLLQIPDIEGAEYAEEET